MTVFSSLLCNVLCTLVWRFFLFPTSLTVVGENVKRIIVLTSDSYLIFCLEYIYL